MALTSYMNLCNIGSMENVYQNPVVFKIHNGTVRSDTNLCASCRHCHRAVGSSSGRETLRCNLNYTYPITLREPVAHCNAYSNRNLPTLDQMMEIAWTLMTDKGGRKIGFQSPEDRRNDSRPPGQVGF